MFLSRVDNTFAVQVQITFGAAQQQQLHTHAQAHTYTETIKGLNWQWQQHIYSALCGLKMAEVVMQISYQICCGLFYAFSLFPSLLPPLIVRLMPCVCHQHVCVCEYICMCLCVKPQSLTMPADLAGSLCPESSAA